MTFKLTTNHTHLPRSLNLGSPLLSQIAHSLVVHTVRSRTIDNRAGSMAELNFSAKSGCWYGHVMVRTETHDKWDHGDVIFKWVSLEHMAHGHGWIITIAGRQPQLGWVVSERTGHTEGSRMRRTILQQQGVSGKRFVDAFIQQWLLLSCIYEAVQVLVSCLARDNSSCYFWYMTYSISLFLCMCMSTVCTCMFGNISSVLHESFTMDHLYTLCTNRPVSWQGSKHWRVLHTWPTSSVSSVPMKRWTRSPPPTSSEGSL